MLTKASVSTGSDGVTVCLEPAAAWEITIDSSERQRPCKVHYLYVCVVLSCSQIMRRREGTQVVPNEGKKCFMKTTASRPDQYM